MLSFSISWKIAVILLLGLITLANCSTPSPGEPGEDRESSELSTNKAHTIKNFKLKDINGKTYSLSDFSNSNAVVVMFIATRCPYSNAYNERMVKLYQDYHPKGIEFVGINSNKTESIDEIKDHAAEHQFPFVILKDWNNNIADEFGASYTPEIFVLDSSRTILYHGRIDNSYKLKKVKTHDLRNALNEILSGKPVSVAETKAFGCTIKRVDK
ncbi:MAG: thioredoxin family protein [Calditrichia bacterium]